MVIVRVAWYCADEGKVIHDVRLFNAISNKELGEKLDEYYQNDIISFTATWVGEDSDCLEITEDIAAAIEKIHC